MRFSIAQSARSVFEPLGPPCQCFILSPLSAVLLGVFLPPRERDTSPSESYPQHYICCYPFYTCTPWWDWHCESNVSTKSTTKCSQSTLDPRSLDLDSSTVTHLTKYMPVLGVQMLLCYCSIILRIVECRQLTFAAFWLHPLSNSSPIPRLQYNTPSKDLVWINTSGFKKGKEWRVSVFF